MLNLKVVRQSFGAGHNYWAVTQNKKVIKRFEGRGAKVQASALLLELTNKFGHNL